MRKKALKIEKNSLENHEVKLDVALDKEEFAPYTAKAVRKIAGSQRIPGFRPGKAPANVIKNMFGEQAIAQEAFDMFLEEKYGAILNEAGVEPGAMGRLESIEDIITPKFSLVIPLKATVDLGDYRSIREDYHEPELPDQEIEDALKNIKQPYAVQEPVDGAIEDGFSVSVMIKGELDEPMEEGGTKELVKEMPYEFIIGSDDDEGTAWPYPKFTQSLIGHKEGDVVTSEYTYPDDTPITALKGHTATYTTTIQSVKKLVLPENDDDFAKNFGSYDTFDALYEDLKKQLLEGKKQDVNNQYIEAVMKKMGEMAKVEFSDAELKEVVDERLNEQKARLQQRGIGFDAWLKMKKTDEAKFVEEELKPDAIEQLKRRHILSEFAKNEKINLNFEKYRDKSNEMMRYFSGQLAQIKNKKQRDEMLNNISENALNEAFLEDVFGRLMSIAKGENPAIEDPAEAAAKAAAEAGAEIEAAKEAAPEAVTETKAEEAPAETPAEKEEPKAKPKRTRKKAEKPADAE